LKSKLDPKIYGPAESAITTELVEQQIRGFTTVQEVLFLFNGTNYIFTLLNKMYY
jgi:hypothetical protein